MINGVEQPSELVDMHHSEYSGKIYPTASDRVTGDLKTAENKLKNDTIGMVSFTFDGAFAEDKLTKSIFDDHNMICNFAPPTDWINIFNGVEFYKKAQAEGYGIEAFTRTHRDMRSAGLDDRVVQREIADSPRIYEQLGLKTTGFVSPNSTVDQSYEKYVEDNYDYAINASGVLDNSTRAVQDPKDTDRYHLTRMSLTSNSLDAIKAAIDKCVAEKKFLLFYDHRTGAGDGYVTVDKLEAILDYCQTKVDGHQLIVGRLADIIHAKYNNSLRRDYKAVQIKSPNYAPTISSITNASHVPYYGFWGYGVVSSTTKDVISYDSANKRAVLALNNSQKGESRTIQVCVDLSSIRGDQQPHFISVAMPAWIDALDVQADFTLECRFYDDADTMIGGTKTVPVNISDERLIINTDFGIPRDKSNFAYAFIYLRMVNQATNNGQLYLEQPAVMIDEHAYTVEPARDYNLSSMDFADYNITDDRVFHRMNVDTQYDGDNLNGRRHFGVTKGSPDIRVKTGGLYELRLETYATLANELTTSNASLYVEATINSDNAQEAQPNNRFSFLKTDFNKNIVGGQRGLIVHLEVGDVLRLSVFKNASGGTLKSTRKPTLTIQRLGD